MPNDQARRDRYQRRLGAMKTERESFETQYRSLAEFVSPRRGRFPVGKEQRNRGGQHFWNKIINSRATWALRVATAGIFNGIMSPSRPWLMLGVEEDPELANYGPAKLWFYDVAQQMLRVFAGSNLYNMAPMMFREELLFGTGCMAHEDDLFKVSRFYTQTVGSYYVSQSDRFMVDTIAREYERTVDQLVRQFSENGEVNSKLSPFVRDQYARGNYDTWVPCVHFVEPNENMKLGSLRSRDKAYRSVYYEPGHPDRDTLLSERGFDEFPFYVPRWEVTNEDIYGTDCPGMTALGDVRQLQHQERRKAQGLDKTVAPPLHGPASLAQQRVQSLPSGGTFYDAPGGGQHTLKPIYEVNMPLGEMVQDMDRVEARIDRAFFVDLFMAISTMEGIQPKNQLELMQRNNERLQQLGPTLERQFGEFLAPLVSREFNQMVEAGIVPPPPPELEGKTLRPRFISTLAMAQQAAATGNLDRFVGIVGNLAAQGFQSAADKIDIDATIDEYAELTGAPPKIVVPTEVARKTRQARQEQLAEAQALEHGQSLANTAKMASDAKLSDDNVASRLLGRGEE